MPRTAKKVVIGVFFRVKRKRVKRGGGRGRGGLVPAAAGLRWSDRQGAMKAKSKVRGERGLVRSEATDPGGKKRKVARKEKKASDAVLSSGSLGGKGVWGKGGTPLAPLYKPRPCERCSVWSCCSSSSCFLAGVRKHEASRRCASGVNSCLSTAAVFSAISSVSMEST